MRWIRTSVLLVALATSACSSVQDDSPSPAPTSTEAPTPTASPQPTPSASPSATTSASPPQLLGSWRTTVTGETVTLSMSTAGTYRIQRGVNVGTGDIRVDGDRIDFFNSSICPGTGEYRWRIEGDSLRFSSLNDPCPGRAEALLNVRYGDYAPPR